MKIFESTYQETEVAVLFFQDKLEDAKLARENFFTEWATKKSQDDAVEAAEFFDDFVRCFENLAYFAFEDMMKAIRAEFKIKEFAETALHHNDLP